MERQNTSSRKGSQLNLGYQATRLQMHPRRSLPHYFVYTCTELSLASYTQQPARVLTKLISVVCIEPNHSLFETQKVRPFNGVVKMNPDHLFGVLLSHFSHIPFQFPSVTVIAYDAHSTLTLFSISRYAVKDLCRMIDSFQGVQPVAMMI